MQEVGGTPSTGIYGCLPATVSPCALYGTCRLAKPSALAICISITEGLATLSQAFARKVITTLIGNESGAEEGAENLGNSAAQKGAA